MRPIWKDSVGHLFLSTEEECFWMFPADFFLNKNLCITSPCFSHEDETWRLVKRPSTFLDDYVTFYVWRKVNPSSRNFNYSFHLTLKTPDETILNSETREIKSEFGVSFSDFCCLSTLTDYSIYRCGLIKLVFTIRKKTSTLDFSPGIAANNEEAELETESEEDKKTDEDEEKGAKTEEPEAKGVERLVKNLKQIYLNGQNSDAILEVDGREFHVHKAILAARSPVFASMFQHDTIEKKRGVVDIPDCIAESFEVFLLYLYTGSADTMSPSNVFNLYYAADKYRIDDLKGECVEYMISILSVETFCDVIALSLRHGESKLQKEATRFFQENVKKIIKTVQWQKYMSENTTHANELFIKALNA